MSDALNENDKEKLIAELQELIIETMDLEDVTAADLNPNEALFGEEGLGLDSIDAIELGVAIKRRYKVTVDQDTEDVKHHFSSLSALADFIMNSTRN